MKSKGRLSFWNPEIDNVKLDMIYDQIANYMLRLSQLDFAAAGAISFSKDLFLNLEYHIKTSNVQHE
jgi:hypothetical protein